MAEKNTVALVPAYNEETRISSVLEVIVTSSLVNEIIVIDDGSRDGTAGKASSFPVQILRSEENKGKGAALQWGIDAAPDADYFLFLDADLLNFKPSHIENLLAPLLENEKVDMTIGVFRSGKKESVNLAQHYFSILNGQRALRRDFIDILPDLTWSRFGVEILLTKYAQLAGKIVTYPELQGISHVTKEEKLGFWGGTSYRLQMYNECLYSLFHHRRMIRLFPGRVPSEILKTIG
jgi:glycosyltransferase involved in cell wall biosynthesis